MALAGAGNDHGREGRGQILKSGGEESLVIHFLYYDYSIIILQYIG